MEVDRVTNQTLLRENVTKMSSVLCNLIFEAPEKTKFAFLSVKVFHRDRSVRMSIRVSLCSFVSAFVDIITSIVV